MNRQPYSGHSIDIEMVTETAALLFFLLLKMNISDRGGKNMKSKIVRGIIDRKSTRLNSSHSGESRMPSSA